MKTVYLRQKDKMYFIRLLYLITCMLFTISSKSQNYEQKKLIKKYDVARFISTIKRDKPELFWCRIAENNKRFKKLYKAIKRGKESALNAQNNITKAKELCAEYYNNLPTLYEYNWVYGNRLQNELGIKNIFPGFSISFVLSDELNACCTPEGKVYVNEGLLRLCNFKYDYLLGIVTHETAHVLLHHSLERAYQIEKRINRGEIMSDVLSVILAEDLCDIAKLKNEMFEIIQKGTYEQYFYRYSKEQEFEADIIAYRFLDFLGIGGDFYIETLRLLLPYSNANTPKSNHPTITQRIELLKSLPLYTSTTKPS